MTAVRPGTRCTSRDGMNRLHSPAPKSVTRATERHAELLAKSGVYAEGVGRHGRCFCSGYGRSPMAAKPQVTKENDVWVIRVEKENGKVHEYRCASEAQARNLAQVLSLPK